MQQGAKRTIRQALLLAGVFLLFFGGHGEAVIEGIQGTHFVLTARTGHIITPDGGSLLLWGYANNGGTVQYPGPTLIINQGTTVTITLNNHLAMPVSIVFPGQTGVTVSDGPTSQTGLLTEEALPGGSVTYQFVASHAGTYLYHSGTRPELQVEMGLVGAIIVRPTGFNPAAPQAYNHPDTRYNHEYLFLLSEMDPVVHDVVEFQGVSGLGNSDYFSDFHPTYWFINGRSAPDTFAAAFSLSLPTQPYNCMPRMHPGEKLLMRILGAGKDLHPFHYHGNHARIVARDGRLLTSAPGQGADLSYQAFTTTSVPGETVDQIFEWTGRGLGWDIYGTGPAYNHNCSNSTCPDIAPTDGFNDATSAPCYDENTKEYCPDHGKPIPVTLPDVNNLTLGGFYSGSPFLGAMGFLPPGEGGFNPNAGFMYMWHSHTEMEMVNFGLFPGGMMTVLIIEPPGVPIP